MKHGDFNSATQALFDAAEWREVTVAKCTLQAHRADATFALAQFSNDDELAHPDFKRDPGNTPLGQMLLRRFRKVRFVDGKRGEWVRLEILF